MGNSGSARFQTPQGQPKSLECSLKGVEEPGWLFNVLEYCDSTSRSNCILVSKRYYKLLTTTQAFKWRLERLHIEHGIYSPTYLPEKETWRSLYINLYKRRHLWQAQENTVDDKSKEDDQDMDINQHESIGMENFNISVGVRFKPDNTSSVQDDLSSGKATLPLHQRLALIKLSNNLSSNKDAICVLKNNGEWFKEHWESMEKKRPREDQHEDMEPHSSQDGKSGEKYNISCGIHDIDSTAGRVMMVDATKGLREFEFDQLLEESSTQASVYNSSVKRLVCDFINGFNATCIVYGQTGSGKTYTMFGPHSEEFRIGRKSMKMKETYGIVPRACAEIFEAIEFRNSNLKFHITASVSISYVEIYGNDISDLLKNGTKCGQSRVAAQRFVLSGASEVKVLNTLDVMNLLHKGEMRKRKAQTAMNERSSRAHSIFIVTLRQKCSNTGVTATSNLFLVDLGGSEQTKKSNVESGKSIYYELLKETTMGGRMTFENEHDEMDDETENIDQEIEKTYSTGFVQSDRMREAVYINLGLLSLKQCVEALKNKNTYIPYATSKLTMMLSTGLGGNCKTSVIVCVTQEKEHTLETIGAMKFGEACRQISKPARSATTMIESLLSQLDEDIRICEENIKKKEIWEVREEKRIDSLNEATSDKVETFKTTVLVGAEEDRRRLNVLLQKRAKLTGGSLDSSLGGKKYGGQVGFGNAHAYGLGNKFDAEDEKEINRFKENVDINEIPDTIKGVWKSNDVDDEDSERLHKKARSANRSKLAYSGISA